MAASMLGQGKNNRQRRGAKQRAKRRGASGSTRPSARAHLQAEEGTSTQSGNGQQDSAFSRPPTWPNFEELRRQQAERSVDRLLRFHSSGPLVSHFVELELAGVDPRGLLLMDELITGRLYGLVSALWEHGSRWTWCMLYARQFRGRRNRSQR